jgi:hypothetical protein
MWMTGPDVSQETQLVGGLAVINLRPLMKDEGKNSASGVISTVFSFTTKEWDEGMKQGWVT